MTNDREDFERVYGVRFGSENLKSWHGGGYYLSEVDNAYQAWQASQADQVKRVKELEAIIAMYKGIKKCTHCNIEWSDSNLDCPKCGKEVSL